MNCDALMLQRDLMFTMTLRPGIAEIVLPHILQIWFVHVFVARALRPALKVRASLLILPFDSFTCSMSLDIALVDC